MDRETVIKLARESYIFPTQEKDDNGTGMWFTFTVYKGSIDALEKFAKLVAEHEREACAKVCDELPAPTEYSMTDQSMWDVTCMDCASAIRARGNT